MSDDLIVVKQLTKRYGRVTALSKVDLSVKRGEFLSLLGPSGCGKTTLLRAIAGFIDPSEGEIFIEERSMNRVPPNRRPINTVFQNYALFPHMSVGENIAFGPNRRRTSRREVNRLVGEALKIVGMESYSDRYPNELSGGQQQRVALARAIVNKPKALLLDEPLSALDLKLRKHMRLELKRLHEQLGITFIYVTHDQEEVLIMADRIAVMRDGVIDQIGTGQQIYHEPNSSYVADFIGEANLISCRVAPGGSLRVKGITDSALPYTAHDGAGESVKLMIRPEDIEIGELEPAKDIVSVTGMVREVIFAGSNTKVVIALGEDQEITAQPRSPAQAQKVKPGHTTTVHWQRDNARVLVK